MAPTDSTVVSDTVPRTGSGGIVGVRPNRRRAILGLWAMHPYEPQFPELDWTRGGGVQFSQWFLATFINSYDDRSFIAGIERYWLQADAWLLPVGVGYRVGLITGYDERLFELARHVPILPFGGIVGWVDVGPIALDVFYVWKAITFEAAVRF